MDMGKTDKAIELVSSSEELPPLLAGWSTLGLKSTSGAFTALSLRCLKLGSRRRRERIQVGLPFVERGAHGSGTICTEIRAACHSATSQVYVSLQRSPRPAVQGAERIRASELRPRFRDPLESLG